MLKNRVQDILVPLTEYPHIRDTATLRDAFAVLNESYETGKRYRHILVLNAQGQLVGLIGVRDLLRGVLPDYLRTGELHHFEGGQPDVSSLALIWQETCETQCKAVANNPIRGFMGAVPGTVKPDDPITLAAYLMVTHDSSMLPVVDDRQIIGVVRVIDVFSVACQAVLHD